MAADVIASLCAPCRAEKSLRPAAVIVSRALAGDAFAAGLTSRPRDRCGQRRDACLSMAGAHGAVNEAPDLDAGAGAGHFGKARAIGGTGF